MVEFVDQAHVREESAREEVSKARRSFLNLMVGGALTAGMLGSLYTAIRYLWPSGEIIGTSGGSSGPVIIPLEELPVGQAKKIRYLGKPYLVVRDVKEFSAVSAVCTHLGCIVNWDAAIKKFVCPCHTGMFDIHGNVVSGPPPKPLPTAPFKVTEDQIIIGA